MADLPDYYTQAQISEAEAASVKGGLDANKSATPVSRNIYFATDTGILYICVVDGVWTGFDASILTQGILTLYENMDANSKKIINLAAPTLANDATRKAYVDALVTGDVATHALLTATHGVVGVIIGSEDTIAALTAPAADFSMNTHKITNLVDPAAAQDAATRAYVLARAGLYLPLAGGTMAGAIAMGTNKITGLGDPALDQDAATRAYVIAYAAALVHAARHQNGGADEISIAGLDGESVNLASHRLIKAANAVLGHVIVEAGSDIDVDAAGKITLGAHAARHENAGDDEISVAGLSGLLADDQHVLDAEVLLVAAALVHAARHQNGGADEISVADLSGLLADDQHVLDAEVLAVAAAKAHESTHVSGGSDDIDSALAIAAMADLTTGKIWKGVGGRPSEVDPPTDVTATVGDVLEVEANAEQSTNGTTYLKVKEIKLARGGTYRVKFDLKLNVAEGLAYGRIYKNAAAVGAEQTEAGAVYITKSEDIAGWVTGDLLQLYIKHSTGARYTFIQNLKVYSNITLDHIVVTD